MKKPRYLFLQGQISRFFSELGRGLSARGCSVRRIDFNSGDRQFWTLPNSESFTGRAEDWPAFLAERLHLWEITDIILFGDCRPLHVAAIALARARGIVVQVFEEGYLRPDFITLEEGGVNGHSPLPREAAAYLQAAAALPPWQPVVPIESSFTRRATEDILYNLSRTLGAWRFPHYRSHRPWHPFVEYAVGLRRFPLKILTAKRTARQACAVQQGARPYFLFSLQLDADSQIRFHAPPGGMSAAIHAVMHSFAAHAGQDALLVLTEHPLDYGPVDLARVVAQLARELGLQQRVVFLRGGSPAALMGAARGLVTVNSTMGLAAMAAKVPVIALGRAIYNMAGLTSQDGIDAFWQQPQLARPEVFDAMRRVLIARTQINGGFYSQQGIARAVAGALQRLEQSAANRAQPAFEQAADKAKAPPTWPSPQPAMVQSPAQA